MTVDIQRLLDELNDRTADSLESQVVDFKELPVSKADTAKLLLKMAVCMANGGGGTVILGVKDRVKGRASAIVGVPNSFDSETMHRKLYDSTEPPISVVFESVSVAEGTGRVLAMHVPGGVLHTDTAGSATIRVGTECKPLTATERDRIGVSRASIDRTAQRVPGDPSEMISASALEVLRSFVAGEAPPDLLEVSDTELLTRLGVLQGGQLTIAGLLLAGTETAIAEHIPTYKYTYLRMKSDTDYDDRLDGCHAIPIAVTRIMERVTAANPIQTLKRGLVHHEFRVYPEEAVREALMNAFGHADFSVPSPIMVKLYPDKMSLSNPGGFIAGITPENILRHPPAARNPALMEALTRVRLVNRSNLGVPRMYKSLLVEGKEPPVIEDIQGSARVTFLRNEMSPEFQSFVAKQAERGLDLRVENLLVLQYLLRHPELVPAEAARITQRSAREAKEILSSMEQLKILEHGGAGKSSYWVLSLSTKEQLGAGLGASERIDLETAKTRVLATLRRMHKSGQGGLSNAEVRAITHYSADKVNALMHELEEEGQVRFVGKTKGTRYFFRDDKPSS